MTWAELLSLSHGLTKVTWAHWLPNTGNRPAYTPADFRNLRQQSIWT